MNYARGNLLQTMRGLLTQSHLSATALIKTIGGRRHSGCGATSPGPPTNKPIISRGHASRFGTNCAWKVSQQMNDLYCIFWMTFTFDSWMKLHSWLKLRSGSTFGRPWTRSVYTAQVIHIVYTEHTEQSVLYIPDCTVAYRRVRVYKH